MILIFFWQFCFKLIYNLIMMTFANTNKEAVHKSVWDECETVYVYAKECACVCVCVFVCVCACACACTWTCTCMLLHMCVCVLVGCMHDWKCVSDYVCLRVSVCVCESVYVWIFIQGGLRVTLKKRKQNMTSVCIF